ARGGGHPGHEGRREGDRRAARERRGGDDNAIGPGGILRVPASSRQRVRETRAGARDAARPRLVDPSTSVRRRRGETPAHADRLGPRTPIDFWRTWGAP